MPNKELSPLNKLKDREVEIIGLMADGLSNQEIADQLYITKETVRWYNKQIYSKLGTSRRTEAIALAREMGVIGNAVVEIAPTSPVRHQLPVTTGPFVGRDNELAQLSSLLDNPDIRLLTIVAAGGMGKSRLALELGHLIQANYERGAIFIDLTATQDPADIATITLESLNLELTGEHTVHKAIFNYCRDKELLLVFDNCEHVLAGVSFLSEILAVAPKVRIIATSRERLNLKVEATHYLQPIIESGANLFSEIAMMMHPDIVIGEGEESEIRRIVEVVGGLPLALILAASWLDTITIAEIATEIEESLDFLTANMGDVPERQRSILAVIDPTWQRLNEQEQNAFMWASVFRGGFSREIFREMSGASLRTVQTLMRRSMLSQGQGRRYDLHPLLRQYAFEKLESQGKVHHAKQAHLAALLKYARIQSDWQGEAQYLASIEGMEVEQDNFRAALDWSLAGHETSDGVALLITINDHWLTRSRTQELARYIDLALLHQPNNSELHIKMGFLNYRMGQKDQARRRIEEAIALAEESRSLAILANGYRLLATVLDENETSYQAMQGLLTQAAKFAEESQSAQVMAAVHVTTGLMLSDSGAPSTEVKEHFQKALDIYEKSGDLQGISRTVYNIGIEEHRQGNTQRFRELCEYSLKLKRQIGDRAGVARRLSVLAHMEMLSEEFERAAQYLAEARQISEETGEPSRLQYTHYMQATLLMIQGKYNQSKVNLEQALQLAIALNARNRLEEIHSSLALIAFLQGETAQALPHILNAMAAIKGTRFSPWTSMMAYANYLWYQGDIEGCVPIVATMFLELEKATGGEFINNNYFLRPLVYRVREQLGEEAWQAALGEGSGNKLEQQFQEIANRLLG